MTAESLMRMWLRAAGRLLARGAVTREQAAAMIRYAWTRASFELLPAGSTSGSGEAAAMKHAEQTEWWCASCPGIPHRVTFAAEKCPVCRGAA